jgi:hypothetical protein
LNLILVVLSLEGGVASARDRQFCIGSGIAWLTGFPRFFSGAVWTGFGVLAGVWTISRSTVDNGATYASITTDTLASFLSKDPIVIYGPGKHFCYWWEQQDPNDTKDITEIPESFSTTVQTAEGIVTVSGVVRLRPDLRNLYAFMTGAAASASDIIGLINARILAVLGKRGGSVFDAIHSAEALNKDLMQLFSHEGTQDAQTSAFERRYAVRVGVITVEEIIPSRKVQKSIDAVTVSKMIDQDVARSFGKTDTVALEAAILHNEIPRNEVTRRRIQALITAGILTPDTVKENTTNVNVNIEGLSPELAKAFAEGVAMLAPLKGGKHE